MALTSPAFLNVYNCPLCQRRQELQLQLGQIIDSQNRLIEELRARLDGMKKPMAVCHGPERQRIA